MADDVDLDWFVRDLYMETSGKVGTSTGWETSLWAPCVCSIRYAKQQRDEQRDVNWMRWLMADKWQIPSTMIGKPASGILMGCEIRNHQSTSLFCKIKVLKLKSMFQSWFQSFKVDSKFSKLIPTFQSWFQSFKVSKFQSSNSSDKVQMQTVKLKLQSCNVQMKIVKLKLQS